MLVKKKDINYLLMLSHDLQPENRFMSNLFGYSDHGVTLFSSANKKHEKRLFFLLYHFSVKIVRLFFSLSWNEIPKYWNIFFAFNRYRNWRIKQMKLPFRTQLMPINMDELFLLKPQEILWTQQEDCVFLCQKVKNLQSQGAINITWFAHLNECGNVDSKGWRPFYWDGLNQEKDAVVALESRYGFIQATTSSGTVHTRNILHVFNTPVSDDSGQEKTYVKSTWHLNVAHIENEIKKTDSPIVLKKYFSKYWATRYQLAKWHWVPLFHEGNVPAFGQENTSMLRDGHCLVAECADQIEVHLPESSWLQRTRYKQTHVLTIPKYMTLESCEMLPDQRLCCVCVTQEGMRRVYREHSEHPTQPVITLDECELLAEYNTEITINLSPQIHQLPFSSPPDPVPDLSYFESPQKEHIPYCLFNAQAPPRQSTVSNDQPSRQGVQNGTSAFVSSV